MAKPNIVLYGHLGCRGSQSARAYFLEHQIDYEYRDIGKDPTALAEFTAAGGFATPLILVGGNELLGFDPEEFERVRWLAQGAQN